jgi:hypothetical protein
MCGFLFKCFCDALLKSSRCGPGAARLRALMYYVEGRHAQSYGAQSCDFGTFNLIECFGTPKREAF